LIITKTVKDGDKVKLLYEAKSKDGTIWYKNKKENPLEIVVGKGNIFPAIEKRIKNMKEGEEKTISLKPEEAFGKHREDLVCTVPKNNVQTDFDLDIGSKVNLKSTSGKKITGTVTETKDDILTIDFNHPLAGKIILFTFIVLSIIRK
jgi:FKBP-type peptidyl-prolyl cis-trans isomerase 2